MIIKSVTQVGNPLIRSKSKAVKNITSKEVKKIVKDLTDSMRYHGLVGMAAPQIGAGVRIFVVEVRSTKSRNAKLTEPLRVFINPKITSYAKKLVAGYEGCGSVAASGLFGLVNRQEAVTVKALDENGLPFILRATGLMARIIQHEMDHLDGIIFLDRMEDTKTFFSRNEYISKFKK